MKYIDAIELHQKLVKVKGITGFEAKLIIRKNISNLKREIKPLEEEEKELIEITAEYNKEAKAIYNELSGGKTKGVQYDVPAEKEDELNTRIAQLKVIHKDSIATQEQKNLEFKKMLKEKDSDFVPVTIPLSLIEKYESPVFDEKGITIKEGISEENLGYLWDIIEQPAK